MLMSSNIIVSECKFKNLRYLNESVATLEEKWKNIFFLCKSIGLGPKIEMKNISASICPICMILGSSQLVISKVVEKMVTSITNQLFLLSRSYKGQLKVKVKGCLKSVFCVHLVIGLVASNFRLILCMSSIFRRELF